MNKNPLKVLLQANGATLGTCMMIPWPRIVDIIGSQNVFDYLEFRSLNSSWDFELVENFARAFTPYPSMASMISVLPHERQILAPRAVAAGIQNVQFPDINSADEVRECIRLLRPHTPEDQGELGWGFLRLGEMLNGNVERWIEAVRDVGVSVVIENRQAFENVDEILDVPGINMVAFGARDFSINSGLYGKHAGEEVQEVQRIVARKALERGLAFRVHLHSSDEDYRPWLDIGVKHFFIQSDTSAIKEMCRGHAKPIKDQIALLAV